MRLREVVLHALQSKDIWNIDLMDSIPVVLILIFESEPYRPDGQPRSSLPVR